jgi:hypothetical protein
MKLLACEIQGRNDAVRIEAPDSVNKLNPGFICLRYGKFDKEVVAHCEDSVVIGQKISLKIGYDFPEEADAVAELINMIRECNPC